MGFALWLSLAALPALAHRGSDAFWRLHAEGAEVGGQLELSLRDLALLFPFDPERGLTEARRAALGPPLCEVVQAAVGLRQGASPCPLRCGALHAVEQSDGPYVALPLQATCPQRVEALGVRYALLSDRAPDHRVLLSLGAARWDALTPGAEEVEVRFGQRGALAQAAVAFTHGVHHIAIGWDHLCFLFALLLPSVLRRRDGAWAPREVFRPALLDVVRVVTAFTVAHSITLALAAFGVLQPDARQVELAIALSVALAAFNNLVPFAPDARWALAFALGLLHGFGFVSAIGDLGVEGPLLWLSVLGFNLGVEAGQLVIVALGVPVLWRLRARRAYVRVLFPLGSAVILGVALFWTVERL